MVKYPKLVVEILLISLNKALQWWCLKYEYILIKTGSDEILLKNVDGVHLHHNKILHAKSGKNWTVRFRSSARTYIYTYIRTDEILCPCHKGITN